MKVLGVMAAAAAAGERYCQPAANRRIGVYVHVMTASLSLLLLRKVPSGKTCGSFCQPTRNALAVLCYKLNAACWMQRKNLVGMHKNSIQTSFKL
jgi:hypothetical protein